MKTDRFNYSKKNNKGYTMLELIIIITIIMVLVTISAASMSLAFKSRASSAATNIESLLSRSKINSLSGRKNIFKLSYSEAKDCYLLELYDVVDPDSDVYEDVPYETQEIGTKFLNIYVNDDINIKEESVSLKFKPGNGALEYAKDEDNNSIVSDQKIVKITVSYGSVFNVTVYSNTGAIIKGQ